jgi:hypothetical protein
VLLESVKLLKTPDTSSPTSQTELESANLELFSSKTYKESSEHWKDWVIEQRQEYSQRKKSAHLIRESESTSLELEKNWATPQVTDVRTDVRMPSERSAKAKKGGIPLAQQVKNWSTPTVMDTANIQQPRKKNPSGGQKPPLCQEVNQLQNWPTASARDWKDTAGMSTERDGKALGRVDQLPRAVFHQDGLLDQASTNTNGKSQELQGKLNPNWVEHLMGLPVGWTDLGSWETE